MTRAEILAEVEKVRMKPLYTDAVKWFTAAVKGKRCRIAFHGWWLNRVQIHNLLPVVLKPLSEVFLWKHIALEDAYWAQRRCYGVGLDQIEPLYIAHREQLDALDAETDEQVWQAIQEELKEAK